MITDRLDALATALKRLPGALTAATVNVVTDNAYILELDNQQQLEAGLDADGRTIEPAYTFATVRIKEEKGQESQHVTLRDRGDFYRGIVARVRGEAIEVVGTDKKTQALQEKYGEAIIGLSEEAIDAFREDYVRPELEYQTRHLLGL